MYFIRFILNIFFWKKKKIFDILIIMNFTVVEKYKSIKLTDPNRGIRSIASELDVPRSCLQDWCKKYKCFKDKVDLENK